MSWSRLAPSKPAAPPVAFIMPASAAWSTVVCAPISAVRVSERNPPTFIRAIDPEPDA